MSEFHLEDRSLNDFIKNNNFNYRRKKISSFRQKGIAFPNDFRRDIISDTLYLKYKDKTDKELKILDVSVSIAGRMMTRRIMGKASFATLQDFGGKIQIYVSYNSLPENVYNEQFKKWDLGDILGASGKVFKTRTGELSVYCTEIRLLTKSIRPLPEKFHGLNDKETRYRQRYLDLIVNDKSKNVFKIRSRILSEIRIFMMEHQFIEVETPMMQITPGGAMARSFSTHHNALNIDMHLRISPELYLKRLIVGGFERIFEINRNFRNEGLSQRHNPEFTMMELYIAYADYKDLMVFIEDLFRTLTQRVLGKSIIQYGEHTFNFEKPFTKMTMKEAICYYHSNASFENIDDITEAIILAESLGITIHKEWGLGRIQTEIFEKIPEKDLIDPIFITDYPAEVSTLARRNDDNPFLADRFELFIGGHEIGNGFSELNDSEDQSERFINQLKSKHVNNNETVFYDEDYIIALEHGLPPTAGLGIGIDRLIMLFTNSSSIRDVILFPTLRPFK